MQLNIYPQLKQLPQQAASTVLSQLRELLASDSIIIYLKRFYFTRQEYLKHFY